MDDYIDDEKFDGNKYYYRQHDDRFTFPTIKFRVERRLKVFILEKVDHWEKVWVDGEFFPVNGRVHVKYIDGPSCRTGEYNLEEIASPDCRTVKVVAAFVGDHKFGERDFDLNEKCDCDRCRCHDVLENLWIREFRDEIALNPHRPEHYGDPRAMSYDDRMVCTCDLLGQVLANARKHGIPFTIGQARAIVEKWPQWEHALKTAHYNPDGIPDAEKNIPELPNRWKTGNFPIEEMDVLKRCYEELEEEEKFNMADPDNRFPGTVVTYRAHVYNRVFSELLTLKSVQYYLEDLEWYRKEVTRLLNWQKLSVAHWERALAREYNLTTLIAKTYKYGFAWTGNRYGMTVKRTVRFEYY